MAFEWNETTIGRLRALWGEGYSTVEIGRRMGCGKNAIVGKSHRLGLSRPSPIPTGWPEERSAEFRRLWMTDTSRAKIAARFGISLDTVHYHATRLKLRVRGARKPPAPEPLSFMSAPRPVAAAPVVASPVSAAPSPRPARVASRVVWAPTCQWPTHEGNAAHAWLFCEKPSTRGSYCEIHSARCYSGWRAPADVAVAA